MEVEEADELQVFFPSDEACFFPEFPDGALQEIFASFDFTAEAIPLADAKAAFLRPNKSFPSERTGKQSVVGRIVVLPLFMEVFVFFRQFLQNRFDSPGNVVRRQHRLEGHVLQTAPADAAQEQVDGLVVKATEDQSFLGHRRKIFVFIHLFMDLGLFRFLFHGCNFSDFIVRQSQDFADGFTFSSSVTALTFDFVKRARSLTSSSRSGVKLTANIIRYGIYITPFEVGSRSEPVVSGSWLVARGLSPSAMRSSLCLPL